MNTQILICPVCGAPLFQKEKSLTCENNHVFDISKNGYVNLLCLKNKSGEKIGDNKQMAKSRHEFLSKDYFLPLAKELVRLIDKTGIKEGSNILDICCGEGYYTKILKDSLNSSVFGFDISKNMVELAAKRHIDATFFVASLKSIPVKSESVDGAVLLFAPFLEDEIFRILKPKASVFVALPAKRHLFELKEILYDTPYENDEQLPQSRLLTLKSTTKVKSTINLNSHDEIMELFSMTPYFYHTSDENKNRLSTKDKLCVTTEFLIAQYTKNQPT